MTNETSGLDALPTPQQDALRVAFGLESGEAHDRFLVALATLSLLSEAAEDGQLLCVIEDAQWIDSTSGQVLGFVARRLLAESVAMVFAVREPSAEHELAGIPELRLQGLPDKDARALLATAFTGRLDDEVTDRIVAETRGNPLALLELPRGLSRVELAGGFALPAGDLPNQIEDHYLQRVRGLPDATQRLLLLAAADPVGNPTLLWRAARQLGIDHGALRPAADEELLNVGSQVIFRHPLVRSAVYAAATPDDRQESHRALAEATDPDRDPDRRAWHRAQAASGSDEEIALALEESAVAAQARGGLAAGAAFLERSAELTPAPRARVQRMLDAAQFHWMAGTFDATSRILTTLEAERLDESQNLRVDILRGQVATIQRHPGDAPTLLLGAAQRLEVVDPKFARNTYRDAFVAAIYVGRFVKDTGLPQVAAAIRSAAPTATGVSTTSHDLLDAAALLVAAGYRTGAAAVRRALAPDRVKEILGERDLNWVFLANRVSIWVWDHETWNTLSDRMLELVRKTGELALLPFAAAQRIGWELFAGDLAAASSHILEQDSIQEAIGGYSSPGSRMVLAAFRGIESEVDSWTRPRPPAPWREATAHGWPYSIGREPFFTTASAGTTRR